MSPRASPRGSVDEEVTISNVRHIFFPSNVHTQIGSPNGATKCSLFFHVLNNGSSDNQSWKWSQEDSCPWMDSWRKCTHTSIRIPGILRTICYGKGSVDLEESFPLMIFIERSQPGLTLKSQAQSPLTKEP